MHSAEQKKNLVLKGEQKFSLSAHLLDYDINIYIVVNISPNDIVVALNIFHSHPIYFQKAHPPLTYS